MSRVLITGAHGFLGSHLCEAFVNAGDEVTALVSPWGKLDNLEHLNLPILRADIRDPDALVGRCEGVDVVVHAAAKVADWGRWQDFMQVNASGTANLLREAKRAKVKRFVLISSIAVHPYSGYVQADSRTLPRDSTINAYAVSKRLAEDYVMMNDVPWTIVRPGLWVFGERDPQFARVARAISRRQLPLIAGGKTVLNTAYAPNLARAVRTASFHPAAVGKSYVLADDGQPSWREVFGHVASSLGVSSPRMSLPAAPVRGVARAIERLWNETLEPPLTPYRVQLFSQDIHFNTQTARDELGYYPAITWREGIERTCAALEEAQGI
jgi:nucleoside-diphosphate-sugar epimerase